MIQVYTDMIKVMKSHATKKVGGSATEAKISKCSRKILRKLVQTHIESF